MEMSGSCFSNSDPMDSDNDYTVVEGKRLKRKYRRTTKDVSEQRPNVPPTPTYRIAFVPLDVSKNLNSVHRQVVNTYLGNVAPKGINEVRFNTRKNVVSGSSDASRPRKIENRAHTRTHRSPVVHCAQWSH